MNDEAIRPAEDVALCYLMIDGDIGCYCELPAGHAGPHVCACGAQTDGSACAGGVE
jgi:hypothetical protein